MSEADARRYGMINGWVEPKDRTRRAEYWLTRREDDAAPGYGLRDSPDLRVRYVWNGHDAWITGTYWTRQGERPALSCLHSNNGWRIEESA